MGVLARARVARHLTSQEIAQGEFFLVVHGANYDTRPRGDQLDGRLDQREIGPTRHGQHELHARGAVRLADLAEESELAQGAHQLGLDDLGQLLGNCGV